MTLQQLRYITMVAEKGTISEAAKELFISQPSLTNAIRELEQEMQVTIFHRNKKYDGRSEMVKTERNGSKDSEGACRRLCGLGNLRRLPDAGAVAQ